MWKRETFTYALAVGSIVTEPIIAMPEHQMEMK